MPGQSYLKEYLNAGLCAYTVYGQKGKDKTFLYSHMNKTRQEALAIWESEKGTSIVENAVTVEICCKGEGLGNRIKCTNLKTG